MRTDEALWERIKADILKQEIMGTKANQWSARKSQLAVKRYKEMGGDYTTKKDNLNDLIQWTKQNWRTKSGLPSHITGERYLPEKAIKKLTEKQYQQTTEKKRKDTEKGKQFSKQPKKIAEIVSEYR